MPDLICGYNFWPHAVKEFGRKPTFPEITVGDAQIGGIFCNHELMFGVCFHVPENDPLSVLIESYHLTHMPGRKAEGHSTPLEEVIRLQVRLQKLGLEIDPVCYAHFAEAFIPISFSSATSYSLDRGFAITHESKSGRVSLEPKELGFESVEDVKSFVEAAWTKTEEQVYDEKWQTRPPDNLLGAGIGANSD